MYYARYKQGYDSLSPSYWEILRKRKWWFDKRMFKCHTETSDVNRNFERFVEPELERLNKEV